MNMLLRVIKQAGIVCTALLTVASTALGSTIPTVDEQPPITQGLSTPVRMVSDAAGNLFVADPRAGGIMQYTASGSLVQPTSPIRTAKIPFGIALTSGGDLLVSQGGYVALLSRSSSFSETRQLRPSSGAFKLANGIAVAPDGTIFVTDSLDDCVHVFRSDFSYSSRFGTSGSQPGSLSMPTGIAYEKSANQVAVVDTLNGRIQFFSPTGVFNRIIGSRGSGPLSFTSPQGVSFEYTRDATPVVSRMYVVDSFQSNVQVIDPVGSGTWLSTIGTYGVNAARQQLYVPVDVLFEQVTSRLFVANGYANIALFSINGGSISNDTTPPVITMIPRSGSAIITNTNSLTITGTVNETATITVSANTSAAVGPVTFPTATTWSCTVSSLAIGTNTISVVGRDISGNLSAPQSITITFSTTAPQLTINPVTSPTRNTTQTISGTVESGATVVVTTNAPTNIVGTLAQTGTTWSVPLTGLPTGDTLVTATATKGGVSSAATTVITVHNTSPSLVISALSDGSITASPLLNIYGYVDYIADQPGDISDAIVTLNGQPQPPIKLVNGSTRGNFNGMVQLRTGANTVSVTVTDNLGNFTSTAPRTITYDGTAPVVTVASPSDGTSTSSPTVTVSGTAPAGSVVTVNGTPATLTGTSWTTTPSTVSLTTDDINTINVSVTSGGVTVNEKRTVLQVNPAQLPPLTITTPAYAGDTFVTAASAAISGTATATSITVTVNGTTVPVDLVAGTFTIPVSFGAEGPYAVTITAFDTKGNTSTLTRTLVYVASAPQVAVDAANPRVVTVADNFTTVRDKNGPVASTFTVNPDGSTTVTITAPTYDQTSIEFINQAGISTRNGKIMGGKGRPTILDVIKAMRIATRIDRATTTEMLRGDVAPLVTGATQPDGKIGIDDVLAIMVRVIGIDWL